MSKIEIISEIINVYDENEVLKRKVEMLESKKEVSVNTGGKLSVIDNKLLEYGKQKLVEDLLYDWNKSVNIAKNEDTGELKKSHIKIGLGELLVVTTYQQICRKKKLLM